METNEISVVIQGPIFGKIAENFDKQWTRQACESVRKFLPNAEIIVSTWEGEIVEGLNYDKVIFNKTITAGKIVMPNSDLVKLNTVNHQIITTRAGIEIATKKYILKMRSDMCIYGTKFLDYFGKYNDYPKEADLIKWRIFEKRILTFPTYNVHKKLKLPYNICDWFFFGIKEDILKVFDIPLLDTFSLKVRKGELYPRVEDNFGAEQYIWINFLQKYLTIKVENAVDVSNDNDINFEKSIANNIVLISAQRAQIKCLKFPMGGYAKYPCLSTGLYTFTEWKKLYKKYGGGSWIVIPNIFETALYRMFEIKRVIFEKYPVLNDRFGKWISFVKKIFINGDGK